jgi:hypothetical protein
MCLSALSDFNYTLHFLYSHLKANNAMIKGLEGKPSGPVALKL